MKPEQQVTQEEVMEAVKKWECMGEHLKKAWEEMKESMKVLKELEDEEQGEDVKRLGEVLKKEGEILTNAIKKWHELKEELMMLIASIR
jgi:hypothetical protein